MCRGAAPSRLAGILAAEDIKRAAAARKDGQRQTRGSNVASVRGHGKVNGDTIACATARNDSLESQRERRPEDTRPRPAEQDMPPADPACDVPCCYRHVSQRAGHKQKIGSKDAGPLGWACSQLPSSVVNRRSARGGHEGDRPED